MVQMLSNGVKPDARVPYRRSLTYETHEQLVTRESPIGKAAKTVVKCRGKDNARQYKRAIIR